jgi:hypothetical protein
MGANASTGNAAPLPRTQLVRILKRGRKLALRNLLPMKRRNIEERQAFYKQDAAKYRDLIFSSIQEFLLFAPNKMYRSAA